MTLTIERVIKKAVRRNEYSIVINTGFQMGVSFPVDCVDIIADKMTTRSKYTSSRRQSSVQVGVQLTTTKSNYSQKRPNKAKRIHLYRCAQKNSIEAMARTKR